MREWTNVSFEAPATDTADTAEAGVFAFPASLSQTRFWELAQLRPGNPAYNVAVRFRLEGKLDVPRLERAFTEIVRRHEVLRATFQVEDGQFTQFIAPSVTIKVPVASLLELAAGAREPHIDT